MIKGAGGLLASCHRPISLPAVQDRTGNTQMSDPRLYYEYTQQSPRPEFYMQSVDR